MASPKTKIYKIRSLFKPLPYNFFTQNPNWVILLRFRWVNFDRFMVVNLGRFLRVMFIRPYWVNFIVFSTLPFKYMSKYNDTLPVDVFRLRRRIGSLAVPIFVAFVVRIILSNKLTTKI